MTLARRIKVKFFVQDGAAVDLHTIAPIFHRWIQEHRVGGLLLDVADYKHVQDGPGIVLIGHEADYGMDMGGGRPGLVYDRKRGWDESDSLSGRVRTVVQAALQGCQALVEEQTMAGRIHFRLDEAELSLVDRLNTPNQAETFAALSADIRAALDPIYGANGYTLEQASSDPRHSLTFRIHTHNPPSLAAMLAVERRD
jgi:hypothetical protein